MTSNLIVSAPVVLPYESVSSWLGRLALSQGASLFELSKYLDVNLRSDVDLHLPRGKVLEILIICGLDSRSFDLPLNIFGALRSLSPDGGRFLNVERGRPRYRFCPCCLGEQTTPYFPLHWRFAAWRWCPEHDCLLENACPHCEAPLVGPADQLNAGRNRKGVGLMSYCMSCEKELTAIEPCHLGPEPQSNLTRWEQMLLSNGRAVLAALHTGEVRVTWNTDQMRVGRLKEFDKRGLLPHRFDWLTATHLRVRRDELHRSIEPATAAGVWLADRQSRSCNDLEDQ